jgi:hypothetical protein
VYMGVWLIMFYTVDFARFGRVQDAKFNGWVTFGPVFYFFTVLVNALVGIFLVATLPPDTGVSASLVVGIVHLMGIFGLLFILVTQTKINSANLYLASANLESFFSRAFSLRLPRWFWVLVSGVAVYLFMLTNIFSFLLKALNYQAAIVVAWVAIALVEMAFRRAGSQPEMEFRPGWVPAFNLPGLAAWVVASAIGIALLASQPAFSGTWGPPLTFAVAAVSYACLRALFGNRSDHVARPHNLRTEVPDTWETRVKCYKCDKSYIAIEMDRDPSVGHKAICASCAAGTGFFRQAKLERIRA